MPDRTVLCTHCGTQESVPPGQEQISCRRCGAIVSMGTVDIRVEGSDADEVSRVTRELVGDAAARQEAQRLKSPWVSGTFYLVALAVVVALLLVVGSVLPAWALPVVIVGAVLLLAVVGALQLRHDDRLGDEGFGTLMGEALRRLPLTWTQGAPPPPPG